MRGLFLWSGQEVDDKGKKRLKEDFYARRIFTLIIIFITIFKFFIVIAFNSISIIVLRLIFSPSLIERAITISGFVYKK